ncbi:hypothetical protein M3667_04470 [Microbacterium sp. P26]|uniref:hypothetical protein n=1 Tax=Microbacterium TaxID=33882 RepID=UPI00203DFCC9|nr:hypothetical protein [Microbacterium sp. P26]MCM3501134.1 hypothetical protein [Microbacterium sp. P26]
MRIFLLELRRSPLLLAAPVMYATAGVFGLSAAYPMLASWTNVVSTLFSAQSFIAPLVAGVACWSGLRSKRRALQVAERTAIRSRASVQLLLMAADSFWLLLASAAMCGAFLIRAAFVGLTGVPVFPSLAYGVILPILFCLTGHLIALCLRQWFAIPVAVSVPLALYAINTFGTGSSAVLSLNPLYRFSENDPYEPVASFYLAQILVLAGYCVALVALVIFFGRSTRYLRIVFISLTAAPFLICGVTLLHTQSVNATVARQPAMILLTYSRTGMQIEVMDLYKPVAEDLTRTWGRISELTSGSSLQFTHLREDFDPVYDPSRVAGRFYRLDLNPRSATVAASSVEMAFYDIAPCFSGSGGGEGDWWLEGSLVVRTWFQGQGELPRSVFTSDTEMQSALDFLNRMDGPTANNWVIGHAPDIKGCRWSRTDFGL